MNARGQAELIFLVALLLLRGYATAERESQSGVYEKTAILKSGLEMRYGIFLPKSFSPDVPLPLVLALHYGGEVTPFYGKEFLTLLVEPALEKLGAIIVAPDCPARGWNNQTSVKAVLEFLNHIVQEYRIDTSRVLVLGYSLGGIGAWYFAANCPENFSAAIAISALPDPKTTPVVKTVPLYVIHSRQDEVFRFDDVRKFVAYQKSGGASIRFVAVDDIGHYDTYRFVSPLRAAIPWIKKTWRLN